MQERWRSLYACCLQKFSRGDTLSSNASNPTVGHVIEITLIVKFQKGPACIEKS